MSTALDLSTSSARQQSISSKPDNRSEIEWQARVDTAACYRLMALYRMTDLANGFIGTRVPETDDQFLLARYGEFNEEVTASSLHNLPIKSWPGAERGTDMNAAAVSMVQATLKARPDVNCVLHAHTKSSMILASLQTDLLPISQAAVMLKGLWNFTEFEFDCGDKFCDQLLADLDDLPVLLMRNHGMFIAAKSVPEAFFMAFYLNQACDIQVCCMQTGEKIHIPADHKTDAWHEGYHDNPWWEYDGSREWPALLRKLTRELPGYDL
ncbi:MAG: class II aldolase/adducin family protein [Arenicellales bacterium]|nr:class II aldolase/adducin family protein [Arenicellales bacterium]